MMKCRRVIFSLVICVMFGLTACGKPVGQELVTPEPTKASVPALTPIPTATAAVTEEAEVNVTLGPTETPEPTVIPDPTETPVPTESPDPTETPVPTESPDPTETPESTESPDPTEAPVPTASPDSTEVPEPTASPDPTEVPVPTVTPVPTPKPGAEVTVKFYVPLILKDMSTIEATDAMDFLNKMSVYSWPKKGTATDTAMLNERTSEYLKTAGENLLQNGAVSDSAKSFFGEDVTVSCNGWYGKNRSWYDSTYFIDKSDYYSNFSSKTFSDLGIQKGETLEVYATYTVRSEEGTKAYVPCVLDVQLDMGIFKTTMTYMMAMPIWERIVLPELPGYTLEWVDNGLIMSPDKIRIYDETINHYTLVVKPK